MKADHNEADSPTRFGAYGDVVDMAVKVPTLSGFLVAVAVGTFIWATHRLRRQGTERR
jgi:hypothetical protein